MVIEGPGFDPSTRVLPICGLMFHGKSLVHKSSTENDDQVRRRCSLIKFGTITVTITTSPFKASKTSKGNHCLETRYFRHICPFLWVQ